MPIKLVFEGMNAEEILEEIKSLFGHHFVGQVTEVTEKETVIEVDKEVSTPQEPETQRLSMFLNKPTAEKSEKNYTCKDCGTTESGYWRAITLPHGPLCNACGQKRAKQKKTGKVPKIEGGPCRTCNTTESSRWLSTTHEDGPQCQTCYNRQWAQNKKRKSEEKKVSEEIDDVPKLSEPEPETRKRTKHAPKTGHTCRDCGATETSLWRGVKSGTPQCNACYLKERKGGVKTASPSKPKRTRNLTQHKPVKGSRLAQVQKKETATVADASTNAENESHGAFVPWLIDSLRVSIFSPDGYIVGDLLVQEWYKSQVGNDTSGLKDWEEKNKAGLYSLIGKAFTAFHEMLPTAIITQDTGKTGPMLNVIDPSKVTSSSIPTVAQLQAVLNNE